MTTKNRKSKRLPPSRYRYEKSNPTISVRVSEEFKEELEEMKETSGLSMADVLKVGLEKLKPDVYQFYDRGLSDGYETGNEHEVVVNPYGLRSWTALGMCPRSQQDGCTPTA